jgi:hypothetical protein
VSGAPDKHVPGVPGLWRAEETVTMGIKSCLNGIYLADHRKQCLLVPSKGARIGMVVKRGLTPILN